MNSPGLPRKAPFPTLSALLLGAVVAAGSLLTACGDDGNNVDEPVCGDGVKQDGEACDDGNSLETDSCTTACVEAACGDGTIQFANNELCDDGNTDDNDGCSSTCTLDRCGDGAVNGAEACDDGNAVDTDACRNTCVAASCGDGVVETGIEACDDGNDNDSDACTTACAASTCGDGVVQAGEQCDDDNADDTDDCRNNCLQARCGDGVVQTDVEECDDANLSDVDGCRITCEIATCGDGVVQAGVEECDDANTLDLDSCSNSCTQATCGDGLVQAILGETCDDGNTEDLDACTATCQPAACGDGIIQWGVEECDDGNHVDGDRCSNACVADCFPDAATRYIDPATGSCYGIYSNTTTDWGNAEAYCALVEPDGHLVSIGSDVEQALVAQLVTIETVWMGFNDIGIEGTFAWTDGTDPAYTNWVDGEPNDSGGEDCAQFADAGWNDLNCGAGLAFACEQLPVPLLPGIQQNLDPATLDGWTQCFTDHYGNSSTPTSDILTQCGGNKLLMGCRPTGTTTLTLAAMGERADVLFDCGQDNTCLHEANGVGWYFDDNWSWGFAPAGDAVQRNSCDVAASQGGLRMCWHTGGGFINSGYRCGTTISFDGSWERVVYTAP